MLVMLLIGWLAVLPAVVIAGLYAGSRLGGRRAPQAVDMDTVMAFATKGQHPTRVPETPPRAGARSAGY